VDVFHAKNKHHETDAFCNENCNPALFQELRDGDGDSGTWVLNSSAAEQVNKWITGFHAMTREFPVSRYTITLQFISYTLLTVFRYNFFLDEMILLRNRSTVSIQAAQGDLPFLRDQELLIREWEAGLDNRKTMVEMLQPEYFQNP